MAASFSQAYRGRSILSLKPGPAGGGGGLIGICSVRCQGGAYSGTSGPALDGLGVASPGDVICVPTVRQEVLDNTSY